MTIIESLSQGIPVVGTPVGAIISILEKVDRRLICDQATSESLAKKLLWFNKLPIQNRIKLSERGIEVVNKYFTISSVENLILSLYK